MGAVCHTFINGQKLDDFIDSLNEVEGIDSELFDERFERNNTICFNDDTYKRLIKEIRSVGGGSKVISALKRFKRPE